MEYEVILGFLMLLSMVSVIFVGFPIAFTLLFLAFAFGAAGLGVNRTFSLAYLQIWGTMKDEIMPAIPLFVFMGFMTERAGLMERLFQGFRDLLASMKGSLYLAVLLTATVFSMATGIVGASVVVLGIMAGPMMARAGYSQSLSAGAIAAGGTLGILLPPSIMLIVMGPTLGVPVNLLYSAAIGPGMMLAAVYIAYTMIRSYMSPNVGPAVPLDERVPLRQALIEVVRGVLPLAALIGFTLGTILSGLATTTEAASCGALGAVLLAVLYRQASFARLREAAIATITTSAMVLLLAVASNVFGAIFTSLGTAGVVTEFLAALDMPNMAKLLMILALIFVLGWPFEWPAIILVFLPIFLPVIEALDFGMDRMDTMLWIGALIAVNLQTAFLSPPVAMSAYYLRSVMPSWPLTTIYRGMGEFMVLQVLGMILLLLVPAIALWLPHALR
ncbi:TRAP transporter large permease [Rhizobium sp. Root482]|uniref:TRAP transporter large permease n=1 Tax=Rhizobium sp. Root482 TaxID=1736543 RepID=UPI0006FDCB35|nr:TRAP transporter large permease subunit [Rhizobium sp. Root482]KQY16304.1 C4-dicarboxylate ABC transporter [Rhizobium sp. Root482]